MSDGGRPSVSVGGSVMSVVVPELPDPRPWFHCHVAVYSQFAITSGLVASKDDRGNRRGVEIVDGVAVHDVAMQFASIGAQLDSILHHLRIVRTAVVESLVYLIDVKRDFASFNSAYGGYFEAHTPARTTVQVSGFPSDVAIEVRFHLAGPFPSLLPEDPAKGSG